MEINASFALLLATLAGMSTGLGSAIAYFIRKPKLSYLSVMLGFSAGVMVYVSFAELLQTAVDGIGFAGANLGFFTGMIFIALVDVLVPHEYELERMAGAPGATRAGSQPGPCGGGGAAVVSPNDASLLMRAGIFTALGIAIHNLPEGLVTFTSAATGARHQGITVAIAVAIHNIPEGMAVSVPILFASGSRRRAFLYSFASGAAEPVGALIGYAILLHFSTPALLSSLLAFAARIMVFISLDELLPLAHRYGREHLVIIGVGGGMLVMAVSLYLLR